MTSIEIRNSFFDFFKSNAHTIVDSAPMVIKNDPTLMFTNAGMNQFKDVFLGNKKALKSRVANSQKCLRVSGKHNDLEEVGHDTYHHTMFEMLGNWSFGDYFKKEAIDLAWEFLTEKMKIDKDRLYVTVFKGDAQDGTEKDMEAFEIWKNHLPEDRILEGRKKDNFWEMGETGPCGPCSEIHVDIRADEERKNISGSSLINKNHPQVIEIWNLVFMQFNRNSDNKLSLLPEKHVDTGMGFESLCMVVQGKTSNYDTDIFQKIIQKISEITGLGYKVNPETSIAMRVIADHLRAISFSIAEGQLPSNNKAGYVIRRILRRAVRYSYTYLNQQEPVMYKLVGSLVGLMGDNYPELKSQQNLLEKVIFEEEQSFLKTLEKGINLLDGIIQKVKASGKSEIPGQVAFELYDTYGFPLDLTELILREESLSVNIVEYNAEMNKQKSRSKEDATKETSDWITVSEGGESIFTGYDSLDEKVKILKYRQVILKKEKLYQLVLDKTPFYAESGGQVGDSGSLDDGNKKWKVIDTIKENDLIIHLCPKLPDNPSNTFTAVVDKERRLDIINNHSATHLLHQALRKVLGNHVEQKGSLVHPDYIRFDFSHFQKVSAEEIHAIETFVNDKIRQNLQLEEWRKMPVNDAKNMGAMALFGEKYGDFVRVVKFDDSVELCGGTHVKSTGSIGLFKIQKESAIAAGIRRIEAITGRKTQEYLAEMSEMVNKIREIFPASKNLAESVSKLNMDFTALQKELESFQNEKKSGMAKILKSKIREINQINFIAEKINVDSATDLRDISFQVKAQINNLFMILATVMEDKVNLSIIISDNLVEEKNINAAVLIKDIAKHIQGGGGGQPFFATAGGKKPEGIEEALTSAEKIVKAL